MSTTSIRFRHHLESQSNGHNNYKSTALTSHGLFDQLSNWANMWVSSSASTANHQLKVRDPDIYSTRKQYSVIIPRKRKINHNIDIDVSRETDVRTRTNYYHATTMHRQHRTQVPNTNNTAYNKSDMLRVYNCTIQKLQAQQRKRQYKSARPTLSNLIHIRHVWDQIERLIISKSNTNDESATSNIPYLSPAKRFPMYTDKVYLLTHKKLSVSSSSITATAVSTKQKIRASFALSTLVYTTATHQNDITLEIVRILPAISTMKNYSSQRHDSYIQQYYKNMHCKRGLLFPRTTTGSTPIDNVDDDDDDIPLGTLQYIC